MAREIRAIAAAGPSTRSSSPSSLIALPHEREPVVLVVDHEGPGIPEVVDLGPEHARARGVEGGDQRGAPAAGAGGQDRRHALRHLAGGLVREGDGQDLPRVHAAGHQVGDPLRDDAGLAATRPGQDEQRARPRGGPPPAGPGSARRAAPRHRAGRGGPAARPSGAFRDGPTPERGGHVSRAVTGRHRKAHEEPEYTGSAGAERARAPATRPSRSSRGSAAGRRRSPGAPRRGTRGAGAVPT